MTLRRPLSNSEGIQNIDLWRLNIRMQAAGATTIATVFRGMMFDSARMVPASRGRTSVRRALAFLDIEEAEMPGAVVRIAAQVLVLYLERFFRLT
jgi:hypothetical protein